MSFKEKVVLITGAAGNIGREVAARFASEGAALSLVDINIDGLHRVKNEMGLADSSCLLTSADVASENDVERYVRATLERFGRIDVFFNNAGITGNRRKIIELDLEAWQKVMDVDVKGVLLGMKYVLRVMTAQGSGCVINTASQAGVLNQPGGSDYCVAKGVVIHLTKIAAIETALSGIRINCVMPGVVNSDMIMRNLPANVQPDEMKKDMGNVSPLGRMAELSDIANAVCFLASDDASYINGAELRIDGGSSIR